CARLFSANELWQWGTWLRTKSAAARRTEFARCSANRSAHRGIEPRRKIVRCIPDGRVRSPEIGAELERMRPLHQSHRIHNVELALPVIGRCRPDVQVGSPEP